MRYVLSMFLLLLLSSSSLLTPVATVALLLMPVDLFYDRRRREIKYKINPNHYPGHRFDRSNNRLIVMTYFRCIEFYYVLLILYLHHVIGDFIFITVVRLIKRVSFVMS